MSNMPELYLKFSKPHGEFKGRLALIKNEEVVTAVVARSGQPGGYQDKPYWFVGRSPIPPSNEIVGSYEVDLAAYRVNSPAMGEWFYQVLPNPLKRKNDWGLRSEIGIHKDTNYTTSPGTAGCIGVSPNHWEEFDRVLHNLFMQGISKLPLYVVYY